MFMAVPEFVISWLKRVHGGHLEISSMHSQVYSETRLPVYLILIVFLKRFISIQRVDASLLILKNVFIEIRST